MITKVDVEKFLCLWFDILLKDVINELWLILVLLSFQGVLGITAKAACSLCEHRPDRAPPSLSPETLTFPLQSRESSPLPRCSCTVIKSLDPVRKPTPLPEAGDFTPFCDPHFRGDDDNATTQCVFTTFLTHQCTHTYTHIEMWLNTKICFFVCYMRNRQQIFELWLYLPVYS